MCPQVSLTAQPFKPSYPITGGSESTCLYRAANLKTRGYAPNTYLESYAGSFDMGEPIPTGALTGTLAFSPASDVVTGTGTDFYDELHIGQLILADAEPIVVKRIVSATSFISARVPTTTETVTTATRLPVIFELDINRGTQLTGNALHFDKGTILDVGSGVLRVNGAVLPGDSLTANRRAQVALYDSATGLYDVQDIGFDDIPTITNANMTIVPSGGTKNMPLGYYSFQLAYYSDITTGYGNPTPTLLSGGTGGYQITVANSTFRLDKSADTPPDKATGYIIYASAFGGSSAISQVNAVEGAWFELKRVPFSDFAANIYTFEYVDNDLSANVASADNDNPPDAEYYSSLDRYPFLISTNGRGVNDTGRETTTNPGPYVSPIKSENNGSTNFDAYPAASKVPTEKGETIIGGIGAAGRIFVMTTNTLQAVTPTGLPTAPFTCRPFWKRGFANPYNLIFVDDTLYGFSGRKAFRSIATGDTADESHIFASDVESQMATWSPGYVFLGHDPKNEEVCFFSSAIRQNDEGYWETDIYPYSLTKYEWQPVVTLTDPTRDMIVSGVATVGSRLYFIAGGRREATTNQHDTFMYDEPSGEDVPAFATWSLSDSGVEFIGKILRQIRTRGKFGQGATVSVYGATPDSVVNITDLETGSNPLTTVTLDTSEDITTYAIAKRKVKNLLMWTLRIDFTSNYDGVNGSLDQLHEISVNIDAAGQNR